MSINAMPDTTVTDLVQQLRTVAAPLSHAGYQQLADAWGWTALDASDKALVAEGPWTDGGRIHVHLDNDEIRSIRVGLSTSTDRSEQAGHDTSTYYRHTTEQAAAVLDSPDGQIRGTQPRTWWLLTSAALHISRRGFAVILTWMTPAEHHELLASESEQS